MNIKSGFFDLLIQKKIILICITLVFLLSAGCYQQVVCNKPYIFKESRCCLDKNNNGICDEDEIALPPTNHNLMDIQKTLSTVLGTDLLLKRNESYGEMTVFSHSDYRFLPISSCMSGCSGMVYVKKLDMDKASVILLSKTITKEEFYDYISGNKNFFLKKVKEMREEYQNELNTTDGLNRFFQKINYQDYPFKNFTLDKNELYDNFSLITSISDDSAVEYDFASINDYRIKYGSAKLWGFDDRLERMLEFTQVITLYCRPDMIIVLYGDRYDWRVRLNKDITQDDIINQLDVNKKDLLPKAKALLDVCIHKYSYGDFLIE